MYHLFLTTFILDFFSQGVSSKCQTSLGLTLDRRILADCFNIRDSASPSEIILNWKNISHIEATTFWPFVSLLKINIYSNRLTSLEPSSFRGLGELRELRMQFNHLRVLPSGLFANLSQLDFLDVSYNELTWLDAGLFSDLNQLTKLMIHGNWLMQLSEQKLIFDEMMPNLFYPANATWYSDTWQDLVAIKRASAANYDGREDDFEFLLLVLAGSAVSILFVVSLFLFGLLVRLVEASKV